MDWRYSIPALFALLALLFAGLAFGVGKGKTRLTPEAVSTYRRIAAVFLTVSLFLFLYL